jgi:hypothetical protein
MFVKAMLGECFVVCADDDVADRHGTEATGAREHRKTPVNAPTRDLDCTFDHPCFSAEGKGDE